jgi:hypothetical protein
MSPLTQFESKPTGWYIARRWAEISAYTVLATLCIGSLPSGFLEKNLPEPFAVPKTTIALALPIVASFLALIWLHWLIGFRFSHLLVSYRYPSLVIASFLGTIVCTMFDSKILLPTWWGLPGLVWVIVIYAAVLIASAAARRVDAAKAQSGEKLPIAADKREGTSVEPVLEWCLTEKPISSANEDLLEFVPLAQRVAETLLQPGNRAVAVVGPFGSGKTSIVNLAAEIIANTDQKRIRFVQVSCWGFDNAAAAQEAVLEQIIHTLAKRVDCFAIRGMPARYAEALTAGSRHFETIFKVVANDPDAQLARLSPILHANDLHLVIVIEDSDRPGAAFDISSIEGLLHRFREIGEISFVITAGSDSKIDFLRLCEHSEVVPDLDSGLVLEILDRVRSYCRSKFPEDIDLVERHPLIQGTKQVSGIHFGYIGYDAWEWQLTKLVSTPRKLKTTIRRFINSWCELHGEVDIDELLIATALRVCCPKVFGFLIRRCNQLRRIPDDPKDQRKELVDNLKDEWGSLANTDFDLDVAARLLQILFPRSHVLFFEKQYRPSKAIQQFGSSDRDVYRDRIFNEVLRNDAMSDQSILRAMINGVKTDVGQKELAKVIERSEEALNIFEFFQRHVKGLNLWHTEVALLALVREKYGNKAYGDATAFRRIGYLCAKHLRHSDNYVELVFEQIRQCIPHNLELATEIHHLLFSEESNEKKYAMAERVQLALKEKFLMGNSNIFVQGLNPDNPTILDYLLNLENIGGAPKRVRNYKQWSWLAPMLLDGVKKFPAEMIPQITVAIGLSHSDPNLPPDFLLNESVLRDLFGERAEELMRELTKPFAISPTIAQDRQMDLMLVTDRAKQWLEKNGLK